MIEEVSLNSLTRKCKELNAKLHISKRYIDITKIYEKSVIVHCESNGLINIYYVRLSETEIEQLNNCFDSFFYIHVMDYLRFLENDAFALSILFDTSKAVGRFLKRIGEI